MTSKPAASKSPADLATYKETWSGFGNQSSSTVTGRAGALEVGDSDGDADADADAEVAAEVEAAAELDVELEPPPPQADSAAIEATATPTSAVDLQVRTVIAFFLP
ncbi:MAG: hypothetical protein NTZ03_13430 [Actinobacteria bacterium]|nr:hypothetical protein [Actinomycetota bacterium]